MGAKTSAPILPTEYQQVEWIGASGAQFFRAFLTAGLSKITVKTKIKWSATTNRQLHGSNGGLYFGVVNGRYQLGQTGTTTQDIPASTTAFDDVEIEYDIPGNTISYNINGQTGVISRTFGTFSTAFRLFRIDNLYYCSCQLKITELNTVKNGVTVNRLLVPSYLKATGMIGMYDIVNQQNHQNEGTGTFTKGADV